MMALGSDFVEVLVEDQAERQEANIQEQDFVPRRS